MKFKHLTKEQRYTISTLKKENFSNEIIAERIRVDKSTIGRELQRNKKVRVYNPDDAQQKYLKRRQNREPYKFSQEMKNEINENISKQWSPEQIAGRRKVKGKDTVSHEWIYH